MTSKGVSTSFEGLKTQGNSIYAETIHAAELPPVVFQSRMTGALSCYFQAEKMATNQTELSSSLKNIAMAYFRIANRYHENYTVTNQSQKSAWAKEMIFHLSEGLNYNERARTEANKDSGQTYDWLLDLKEKSTEWIDTLWDVATNTQQQQGDFKEINGFLHQLCLKFKGETRAEMFLRLGTMVFNRGIKLHEEGKHKNSLCLFKDNNFNLEEAKKNSRNDPELKDLVQDLEDRTYIHLCINESTLARERGDAVWKSVIQDMETLEMDLVWDAVDLYMHAIVMSREMCLESEAIAHSCLGKLYETILVYDKSRFHYKATIDLVEALFPKNLKEKSWYKDALQGIKKYQDMDKEKERKDWEKTKGPILEELKEVLNQLDQANFGATIDEILDYLYTNHPPKKGIQPASDVAENKKLRTAILHYHPDKQNMTDMKWVILCEEITKRLNRRYEDFKCDP